MSFRLPAMLWVFAVAASAIAAFGPLGIAAALFVVVFWIWVSGDLKWLSNSILIAAIAIIGVGVALWIPVFKSARSNTRAAQCENNLRQIASALQNYSDRYGSLPSVASTGPNGAPLLSWRVALLPFLEEGETYHLFDLTKAWDDPVNRKASAKVLEDAKCPAHYVSGSTTDYVAVVGPEAAWPLATDRNAAEFRDKLSNKIVVVEACGKQFRWAEPRDLALEETVGLLSGPLSPEDGHRVDNGFLYKPSAGRYVVFADGRVALLTQPIDRHLAKALLTVGESDQISAAELAAITRPELDWAKCYALASFAVVSLMPTLRLVRLRDEQKS